MAADLLTIPTSLTMNIRAYVYTIYTSGVRDYNEQAGSLPITDPFLCILFLLFLRTYLCHVSPEPEARLRAVFGPLSHNLFVRFLAGQKRSEVVLKGREGGTGGRELIQETDDSSTLYEGGVSE